MNRRLAGSIALATLASLTACAVVPPQVVYTGPRVALVAPPPPRVEVYPAYPVYPVYPAPYYGRPHHRDHFHWDHR